MTRVKVVVAATSLLALGCNPTPPPTDSVHVTEPAATSVDADVNAQNRINAFMYVAVVPKLQSCWSRLQGTGNVVFKHTYRRTGTNWVWDRNDVESSTIEKSQEPLALQCMNEAGAGASFPMEAAEAIRRGDVMNVHWEWPVPFPTDVKTLALISTGGGGGGRECSRSCVKCDCPFVKGVGVVCSCASSCSGYTAPCILDADSKGCRMKLPACATGRMGGFGGGVIALKQ